MFFSRSRLITGTILGASGLSDITASRPFDTVRIFSNKTKSPGRVGHAAPPTAMNGPSMCRPGMLTSLIDGSAAVISSTILNHASVILGISVGRTVVTPNWPSDWAALLTPATPPS